MANPPSDMFAVSVVIPTYNHAKLVGQTLDSVFGQTFAGGVEVIVVNDGSPDNTAEVLRPLAESGRITCIHQSNAGQAAARNRGIAAARGEFIALLDDDDRWPPDHLQWQVDVLRAHPDAVMVFGSYEAFGDSMLQARAMEPAGERTLADFARASNLVSPGMALFRADAIKAVGGLDATLAGTDDWDLYLRLARAGKILFEPRLALYYRVHGGNASRNFWRMYRSGRRVVEKNFPPGSDAALRSAARDFIARYASQMGITEALKAKRDRRLLAMMIALAKAIWIKPSLLNPLQFRQRFRTMMQPQWSAAQQSNQSLGAGR